ncbi:hypothetical protein MCUN1_002228 [Malassezia cuniculi]|uniref:Origin recognition complex subunit 5 C-terminal domain-containing protein n=1 Tax=Malassezia cuniculi TaxID=948313 RepID=A0AAF0EVM7_9BASI|nr:hypothetical protein MCUN1_002228 [Malassezia cuniculi]
MGQLGATGAAASDMSMFLNRIRELERPALIVVSDAQRMRDLWPEGLWQALPRLAELSGMPGRVSVVLISTLPWAAFRTAAGDTVSISPLTVRLPRLSRKDAIALLERDYVAASDVVAQRIKTTSDLSGLYRSYIALLYDSVHTSVRDEQALRLISAAIWRVLAAAVHVGACAPSIAGIRPRFAELLRDAQTTLIPRIEGPAEWALRREARIMSDNDQSAPQKELANDTHGASRTGYPVFGAVMLVAAFLASYNPTNTDVKYYVRELGASRTRRRRRTKASAADAALDELEGEKEVWNRPQFWGPRTFALERLLAIFHALLSDVAQDLNEDALQATAERAAATSDNARALHHEHIAGEFWSRSASALGVLNTLVEQRLIVRMSPAGKLGTVQYRVNAPYAYVQAAARQVGFPLQDWLWDWHK